MFFKIISYDFNRYNETKPSFLVSAGQQVSGYKKIIAVSGPLGNYKMALHTARVLSEEENASGNWKIYTKNKKIFVKIIN